MKLICDSCGRDLNEIWQDNMSCVLGVVLCEDCSGFTAQNKTAPGTTNTEGGKANKSTVSIRDRRRFVNGSD